MKLLPVCLVGCSPFCLFGVLLLNLGQLCLEVLHVLHLPAKLWDREAGWPWLSLFWRQERDLGLKLLICPVLPCPHLLLQFCHYSV